MFCSSKALITKQKKCLKPVFHSAPSNNDFFSFKSYILHHFRWAIYKKLRDKQLFGHCLWGVPKLFLQQ